MDFMDLEMFVASVEEGSFRKAAERVFRSQPAVSMALRKLEGEVGAPLFDRSNRGNYVLTPTGEILLGYARSILGVRTEALNALEQMHALESGRIRIGTDESAAVVLLPRLIQAFHRQFPKIKIEVSLHSLAQAPRELRKRNLDFAVLSFYPDDKDLEAEPLARDELVLVVSPQHRLAGRDRTHIRELQRQSLIVHSASPGSRSPVAEAFRRFKLPLNVSMEITSVETIKRLVAMNVAAAFLPRMCVQEEVARDELAAVLVEGMRSEIRLWVVRRRADSPHIAQSTLRVFRSLAETIAVTERQRPLARIV